MRSCLLITDIGLVKRCLDCSCLDVRPRSLRPPTCQIFASRACFSAGALGCSSSCLAQPRRPRGSRCQLFECSSRLTTAQVHVQRSWHGSSAARPAVDDRCVDRRHSRSICRGRCCVSRLRSSSRPSARGTLRQSPSLCRGTLRCVATRCSDGRELTLRQRDAGPTRGALLKARAT